MKPPCEMTRQKDFFLTMAVLWVLFILSLYGRLVNTSIVIESAGLITGIQMLLFAPHSSSIWCCLVIIFLQCILCMMIRNKNAVCYVWGHSILALQISGVSVLFFSMLATDTAYKSLLLYRLSPLSAIMCVTGTILFLLCWTSTKHQNAVHAGFSWTYLIVQTGLALVCLFVCNMQDIVMTRIATIICLLFPCTMFVKLGCFQKEDDATCDDTHLVLDFRHKLETTSRYMRTNALLLFLVAISNTTFWSWWSNDLASNQYPLGGLLIGMGTFLLPIIQILYNLFFMKPKLISALEKSQALECRLVKCFILFYYAVQLCVSVFVVYTVYEVSDGNFSASSSVVMYNLVAVCSGCWCFTLLTMKRAQEYESKYPIVLLLLVLAFAVAPLCQTNIEVFSGRVYWALGDAICQLLPGTILLGKSFEKKIYRTKYPEA